jgi:hypothetical protein
MTTTFLKRQKERKRQEKQIAKAQKRAQKKLEAAVTRPENSEDFSFAAAFDPNDLNAVNFDPNASPTVAAVPPVHSVAVAPAAPRANDANISRPSNAPAPVPSANTSYFASHSAHPRTPISVSRPPSDADANSDSGSKSA